jgi:hypothetical protein
MGGLLWLAVGSSSGSLVVTSGFLKAELDSLATCTITRCLGACSPAAPHSSVLNAFPCSFPLTGPLCCLWRAIFLLATRGILMRYNVCGGCVNSKIW